MARLRPDALARGLGAAVALCSPSSHALAQSNPDGSRDLSILSDALPARTAQALSPPPSTAGRFGLAPNLPRTSPTLGPPRGWRLGEWEVRVRNRGGVPLRFAVMDDGRACAEETVDPGIELLMLPCGGELAWHDGREVRRIGLRRGGRYEMSWNDGRWVVRPLDR